MSNQPALLLDLVFPSTRRALVEERIRALKGDLPGVLKSLSESAAKNEAVSIRDCVAFRILWAELLFLNRQDADAIALAKETLELFGRNLPISIQLIVADNLSRIQLAALDFDGATTYYHSLDAERVAGIEWFSNASLLEAEEAIENGHLQSALPILWRHLLRSYMLCGNRQSAIASLRFGQLCVKLGALEEASHYFVVALSESDLKRLAEHVTRRRDEGLIRAIILRATRFANLRRHFMAACKFIAEMSEFVPDDCITPLFDWLRPRCREQAMFNGGGPMRCAWELAKAIGHRLAPETRVNLIFDAISHPNWNDPAPEENHILPDRNVLIKCVFQLVSHTSGKDSSVDYRRLAEATIPLATIKKQPTDYVESMNLLCAIATRSGEPVREFIVKELYKPGTPIDRVLAQAGRVLGVDVMSSEKWDTFAKKVVEETLLTVQRVTRPGVPKDLPERLFNIDSSDGDVAVRVTVQTGMGLNAVTKDMAKLSDERCCDVVRAIIEMATHADNVLSNRAFLLSQLLEYRDRCDDAMCSEVLQALLPIARGDVSESSRYPKQNEAGTGSAMLFSMGQPEEIQAIAMIAVVRFAGANQQLARRAAEALADGFVHSNEKVRKGACRAAQYLPTLSEEHLLPLLMLLRDPNAEVAMAAFSTLAKRNDLALTRPMWRLFLLATEYSIQSPDVVLRRHAAFALKSMSTSATSSKNRQEVQRLLSLFSRDIAYSVRAVSA